MSDPLLYTTDDGRSQIRIRAVEQAVSVEPLEMAALLDATNHIYSLHLERVFEDGEHVAGSVVKESLTTGAEWAGQIKLLADARPCGSPRSKQRASRWYEETVLAAVAEHR